VWREPIRVRRWFGRWYVTANGNAVGGGRVTVVVSAADGAILKTQVTPR
jgi:hypothetical protein